jgi:hypothetical protein
MVLWGFFRFWEENIYRLVYLICLVVFNKKG